MKILKVYPRFAILRNDLQQPTDFVKFNRSQLRGETADGDTIQFSVVTNDRDIERLCGQTFDSIEFYGINAELREIIRLRCGPR